VYLAKRAMVKSNEISSFFQKNMPNFFADAGKAGLQPAGPPSGIYFSWDTVKHQTDMAVAVAVAPVKTFPKIKGMEQVKVEGKALYLPYHGAYDKFHDYMKEKNMAWNNLMVEEYITDPMTEKDTAKWQTNIYYFVK
jgi:effector-binding domain-containing protein